jgi:hypothetical protein
MKIFQVFIEAYPPAPYRTVYDGICIETPIGTNWILRRGNMIRGRAVDDGSDILGIQSSSG